jgi:septum formation protein
MLVLASASPRRRELLAQAGYAFSVHPAHINEDPLPGEDPIAYVVRLAREKAEAVLREIREQGTREQGAREQGSGNSEQKTGVREQGSEGGEQLVVLGADTTVVVDGEMLGKPDDAADAARMLRRLSGRTHRVITGIALATRTRTEVAAEVTAVRFVTLAEEEIAAYVATGEPLDKAGAYAIQGRAARWIPRIEGDYFNVVGLPLALVATMLESM